MRIRRTKRLNRLGKELIRERILLDRRDLLEIGCGKALMLSELASRERGRNFIGVERETEIILKAANFLATKKLKNVSLIRADITKIGERLRGRCNLIWIAFPDPWPKKRHQKRRLTTLKNLKLIRSFLTSRGRLRFKTDSKQLLLFTIGELVKIKAKLLTFSIDPHLDSSLDLPQTNYENKWLKEGRTIYFLEVSFLRWYQLGFWLFKGRELAEIEQKVADITG